MNTALLNRFVSLVFLCTSFFLSGAQSFENHFPDSFREAINAGTRSADGQPGIHYWQNSADYFLEASFDPSSRLLEGMAKIVYHNNSPDTLHDLLILLLPDLYKHGNSRDFKTERSDLHDGVTITSLTINSNPVDASRQGSTARYSATAMSIPLKDPFLPQSTNTVALSWAFTLNAGSHMRTGQVDESSFFIAYWYPRIAVYDDLIGWNHFDYTGTGEFYNDFGHFEVSLIVPKNFVVWATGEHLNPENTLAEAVYERYMHAKQSDTVVAIIDQDDLRSGRALTKPSKKLSWEYKANNVSDFAFALSDHYRWDACTFKPASTDHSVFLSTAYDPGSPDFPEVIHIARKSMEYMASKLPGYPFPYPRMTIFNGLDEMEYPMMVNDRSLDLLDETFSLTAHEVCHSYFPFLMGCNETDFAWMDEGLTSYFEYNILRDLLDTNMISIYFMDAYLELAGSAKDRPLITPSNLMKGDTYYAVSYAKAAGFYAALAAEAGEESFKEALHEFMRRWQGKHPHGYDFFNTLKNSMDSDPTPLIDSWFFRDGFVDLFVEDVVRDQNIYQISIGNKGQLPVAFKLLITDNDGKQEARTFKPSIWYTNPASFTCRIELPGDIRSLELIEQIPLDVNPNNNTYQP